MARQNLYHRSQRRKKCWRIPTHVRAKRSAMECIQHSASHRLGTVDHASDLLTGDRHRRRRFHAGANGRCRLAVRVFDAPDAHEHRGRRAGQTGHSITVPHETDLKICQFRSHFVHLSCSINMLPCTFPFKKVSGKIISPASYRILCRSSRGRPLSPRRAAARSFLRC